MDTPAMGCLTSSVPRPGSVSGALGAGQARFLHCCELSEYDYILIHEPMPGQPRAHREITNIASIPK